MNKSDISQYRHFAWVKVSGSSLNSEIQNSTESHPQNAELRRLC